MSDVVIQVCSSNSGGGAEFLAGQLGSYFVKEKFHSRCVYFCAAGHASSARDDIFLDLSPRNPLAIFLLRRILKREVDARGRVIVHAHLTWPFYYVAIAALGLSVELYYTEHNSHNKRRNYRFMRFVDMLFYKRYKRIVCISSGVLESLISWLGPSVKDRALVIPNGARLFDCRTKHRKLSNLDGIKLVSVGSLTYQKGFENIIQAIALDKSIVSKYLILGDGPLREHLSRVIAELELGKQVELLGWVDDVEKYYRWADVQVIPSLWEGFGLVAVEGMSTGLPIVASNVAGLAEVLGSGEYVRLVSSPTDQMEWLSAINSIKSGLLSDPCLGVQSSQQAKKFSLEKMWAEYKALYGY